MDLARNEALRQRLDRGLRGFDVVERRAEEGRAAAVAVAIADEGHGADVGGLPRHGRWSGDAAVLLTRRSSRLRHHAGQWALPGGRLDEGETHQAAALRELEEEIGLSLTHETVLGRLDDFETRSGFVITPIVVWAGPARELRPNPGEVASIHRIPLRELLRRDAPLLDHEHDSQVPVLRMPVGDSSIAAPTAALLYQFREVCLCGRGTRVAHFEQPRFAWR
ncbi:MAG: CoA pyrophosphatase [Myxococcales bacterium]|nr:CoA pyrophosphatase [Myxococcales bacterium]